jgi:hypothetical protein
LIVVEDTEAAAKNHAAAQSTYGGRKMDRWIEPSIGA